MYHKIRDTEATFFDIAKEFKVSDSLVSMINQGKAWPHLKGSYPIRENTRLANIGGRNPNSTFTDDEVMVTRNLFVDKTLPEIGKIYEKTPFSTLKKIVYGVSYQHLLVYKKREAKWFLKGTCIDYPRIEE